MGDKRNGSDLYFCEIIEDLIFIQTDGLVIIEPVLYNQLQFPHRTNVCMDQIVVSGILCALTHPLR